MTASAFAAIFMGMVAVSALVTGALNGQLADPHAKLHRV